jgi:hypothetical protein
MPKSSKTERLKAIRKAWEREQGLVAEGKGTRDWTKEQQEDILDPAKGKAYDENGRAFDGQHMKSAAEYPEYQGDPDNIQFLTKEEHLEAHKGCWQNPTNWYYNPEAKEFVDFGENKPIPCEVINLSEPVRIPVVEPKERNDKLKNSADSAKEKAEKENQPSSREKKSGHSEKVPHSHVSSTPPPELHEGFGDKVMHVVEAVKDFGEKHPVVAGIVKWGGAAALAVGSAYVASKGSGSGRGGSSENDDYSGSNDDIGYDDSSDSRDYPDERSSPREHIVPGHGQHYHTKDGVIWKEKDSYPRGVKHDDEE